MRWRSKRPPVRHYVNELGAFAAECGLLVGPGERGRCDILTTPPSEGLPTRSAGESTARKTTPRS